MNWEIIKDKNNFCRLTGGTHGVHGRNQIEGAAISVGFVTGLPRKYTGGTFTRVPPVPPDLKKWTDHVFDPEHVFQIFRKLSKMKI